MNKIKRHQMNHTIYYKEEYDFTRKKINGLDLSAYLDEQMGNYEIHRTNCNHKTFFDHDVGDVICKKCKQIVSQIMVHEDSTIKQVTAEQLVWERGPDKERWNKYILNYVNGYRNNDFTKQIWYEILLDLPDPFKWLDVYKIFHNYRIGHDNMKTGVSDHWMGLSVYLKFPFVINSKVLEMANQYANYQMTKYKINYNYLLYKFSQLYGDSEGCEKYIPFKSSKAWCVKADEWWEKICNEEGLEFKKTIEYKLYWNKSRTCENLKQEIEIESQGIIQTRIISVKEYRNIFNEEEEDQEGDEVILKWKGNEFDFYNARTKRKYKKQNQIKAYKYKTERGWKYYIGTTFQEISITQYEKILQKYNEKHEFCNT